MSGWECLEIVCIIISLLLDWAVRTFVERTRMKPSTM